MRRGAGLLLAVLGLLACSSPTPQPTPAPTSGIVPGTTCNAGRPCATVSNITVKLGSVQRPVDTPTFRAPTGGYVAEISVSAAVLSGKQRVVGYTNFGARGADNVVHRFEATSCEGETMTALTVGPGSAVFVTSCVLVGGRATDAVVIVFVPDQDVLKAKDSTPQAQITIT
jgi:hypothetical protein